MEGTIAIIAALPSELKPLASGWQRVQAGKGTVLWERRYARGRWIAGCSGMGGSRASLTLSEIEKHGAVDAICSVGWAGSLDAGIGAGAALRIAQVVDTQTGERFFAAQSNGEQQPLLATTAHVANAAEKARLAVSYGARLVDMEAATLARIARAREIPFYCFKAVSDGKDAELPDLNRFIMADGRLRMMPFLAHTVVRPASWPGLIRLGRNSSLAARHLAQAIQQWLEADTV
ncbi:MAG TPA: phosphorylase [Granulicella sp.]